MGGDYRKYKVNAELMNDEYRLWKTRTDEIICIVETYKDKRSLYFAVDNLLPSSSLLAEDKREYHLIMLGIDESGLIHKDFGSFFVSPRGEGNFFRKFGGPELDCYTHCILVAAGAEGTAAETVISGQMPFYITEELGEVNEHEGEMERESGHREGAEQSRGEADRNDGGFRENWDAPWNRVVSEGTLGTFAAARDETAALWCKIASSKNLPSPLNQCRSQIDKYGHYIIGKKNERCFVGIPGRFLMNEKPLGDEGTFALWQPIKGGEKYFSDLSQLTGSLQEEIFGYWIGEVDRKSGQIKSF